MIKSLLIKKIHDKVDELRDYTALVEQKKLELAELNQQIKDAWLELDHVERQLIIKNA